jgi:hypothetical protein
VESFPTTVTVAVLLEHGGSLTRDRKTFRSWAKAASTCEYLNEYGQHRARWLWVPGVRDDQLYELVRFPRPAP